MVPDHRPDEPLQRAEGPVEDGAEVLELALRVLGVTHGEDCGRPLSRYELRDGLLLAGLVRHVHAGTASDVSDCHDHWVRRPGLAPSLT